MRRDEVRQRGLRGYPPPLSRCGPDAESPYPVHTIGVHMNGQIETRTALLMLTGAAVAYIVHQHPSAGFALAAGIAACGVLHSLLR